MLNIENMLKNVDVSNHATQQITIGIMQYQQNKDNPEFIEYLELQREIDKKKVQIDFYEKEVNRIKYEMPTADEKVRKTLIAATDTYEEQIANLRSEVSRLEVLYKPFKIKFSV